MPAGHYENFPVASILLPPALREPIAAIYQFARTADDFADEGLHSVEQRIGWLQAYNRELDAIAAGEPSDHPVFLRLRPVIERFKLPLPLFRDLLDAFSQDVIKDRYGTYDELLDYCRRSANPVGRLLLMVFGHDNDANSSRSDAICTSLQLINHWQDVAVDLTKGPRGRIYLPQEDLVRFGVDEIGLQIALTEGLPGACRTENVRDLIRFEVDRARELMLSGAPLARDLPGRIGLELRTIVAGGLRILDKIEAANFDVFSRRPVLNASDWPGLLMRAL